MWHMVHADAQAAHESMVRQLEGTDDTKDFDPLLNSTWAIYAQFTKEAGLNALVGDLCPLCEVEKYRAGLAKNWIEGCTDGQLENARELKLMPQPS